MNKTELVAEIAEKAGLSKKDSEAAVRAFIDAVSESLKKETRYSWLASVLLKFPRDLHVPAEILRPARPLRSLRPELRSSKQEKH